MKRIKTSLLLLFMLATIVAGAQHQVEYTEFDLPNGLHVILHEDNSTPIVAVTVMYHVGSKNEDPNLTGFAHFFEHLLFEGSENIDRGKFDKYVENAGGTLNANTSNDRTFYYQILPSNQLELGLWLESERMLHAKVEEVGIATQKEVVKEEKRQRIDNQPYGSILEEVFKRAYTQHPYRWTTIGQLEHIDAAEEEDFVNFYNTFYVPNNAVLTIAGDIDVKETRKLVERYFGDIPAGMMEIPRPNVVEPALTGPIVDTVYDNIQLPAVVQAFRIPALGTEDYYAVDMLATLLSQGQSSRLYKSVVDEQQKAVYVGAFPFALEDPGITLAFGISNMGVPPEEVEAAMNAEYAKVRNNLVSDQEMQKVKNQIESQLINQYASVQGIAENLSTSYLFYGDTDHINTEINKYMSVTKEDLQRVAKQYFTDSNKITLYYLPKNQ